MKASAFLVTLALGLLLVPLAAEAQQQGKIPLVGVLEPSSPTGPRRCWASFQQGLRDLGYVEGQNIALGLLLDSRGVDLRMSYTPIFITISSLKPLFFNGLENEQRFLGHMEP
jgi:hypothetical protein